MNNLCRVFNIIILLLFISCAGNAQSLHRVFTFATGDEYQRQTLLNSSTIIQRGKQRLDVNSQSAVYKTYKVTNASDSNYDFTVTIDKMTNTIDALELQIIFDSTKPKYDSTSRIIRGLKYMIGKSSIVQIDKNGIIISGTNPSSRLANDTLLTFSGIQPESFIKGNQFDLVADFSSEKVKVGYAWGDTVTNADQKMISNFLIDNITAGTTVIKFKSSVTGKLVNSNTNGSYTVDNQSGLVLEKKIESIIRGYQVLNNIVFSTTRRVSLTETCLKVH